MSPTIVRNVERRLCSGVSQVGQGSPIFFSSIVCPSSPSRYCINAERNLSAHAQLRFRMRPRSSSDAHQQACDRPTAPFGRNVAPDVGNVLRFATTRLELQCNTNRASAATTPAVTANPMRSLAVSGHAASVFGPPTAHEFARDDEEGEGDAESRSEIQAGHKSQPSAKLNRRASITHEGRRRQAESPMPAVQFSGERLAGLTPASPAQRSETRQGRHCWGRKGSGLSSQPAPLRRRARKTRSRRRAGRRSREGLAHGGA